MSWWQKLLNKDIERATRQYLRGLERDLAQERSARLVSELARAPQRVLLGRTPSGRRVEVALNLLTHFGITTGASGAGKTMLACVVIDAMLQARRPFGVIDAKGELFDRALYLLSCYPEAWDRVVVIDFGNDRVISPFNILHHGYRLPEGSGNFDYFITRRTETLKELLPAQDRLSLRGAGLLRYAIAVLAECGESILSFDRLLTDAVFRARLLRQSRQPEAKYYFSRIFPGEPAQTVAALRARMSALFAADSMKLALDGKTAPDFRELQDAGWIVLVNCAGPQISRGVRVLLQSLMLSDIRQSIFARANKEPYLWFCDEAQNFFRTTSQQEDLADCLNMGRSFGTFWHFICQHLETAVPQKDTLQVLHQNLRWSFTLRSNPQDCTFLRSHLPVSGRRTKPRRPFEEVVFYTEAEERQLLHEGIANLPDREGYLWLKTASPEALRIKTAGLDFGPDFEAIVRDMKNTPEFGRRLSREIYLQERREREDVRNVFQDMAEGYQARLPKKNR